MSKESSNQQGADERIEEDTPRPRRHLPFALGKHVSSTSPVSHDAGVIPPPQQWPMLNRRQMLKLSVAASVLAAMPLSSLLPSQKAYADPSVDLNSPIGKKWAKLGGVNVVGTPTSAVVATPDNAAQYQQFTNGVIIYSVDHGAMLVSTAIFQKWLSLNSRTNAQGQNLLSSIGFPTQDYSSSSGVDTGYFERGMIIVQTGPNTASVVYGEIYGKYWAVHLLAGLPLNEEADAANAGRFQSFSGGDIYWHPGSTTDHTDAGGAFFVHGAIRDRWLALGGAGGSLGYPVTDEGSVQNNGSEIGRSSRFQKGAIYWSAASGAWEVTADILVAYEKLYAGPAGWLGFPTSGQGTTPTSGGVYNNFQYGIIVFHKGGAFDGAWAFNNLVFHTQRIHGSGSGLFGDLDLYSNLHIDRSAGTAIDQHFPQGGDYYEDDSADIPTDFPLTPVLQSDFTFHVTMDGWDHFDIGSDNFLGKVDVTYTVDNLWGLTDGGEHTAHGEGERTFVATFSVKNPIPFDTSQFRQNLFWSFHNFTTDQLSYAQFSTTFSDVDPKQSWWLHPFNDLYYNVAYKNLAKNGNCFGMCLESMFAQTGQSQYAEPIIRFWPDTQDGSDLNPTTPQHQQTINEINIKHGYQLGATSVAWFLAQFLAGLTHDPVLCFQLSRASAFLGDYPLIALSKTYFFGDGHVVRPYKWDDSDPNDWVIHVANPNNPAATFKDDDPPCLIHIKPFPINSFTFEFEPGNTWSGNFLTGGRMYFIPFSLLSSQPMTPFADIFSLLHSGTLFLLGSSGQTQQVTDGANRSFFDPTLTTPPTRWDQIVEDPNKRIPNFCRVPFNDGDPGPIPLEMYYATEQGASYTHQFVPQAGVTDGTPIEWVMHSDTLASRVIVPASNGLPDQVAVQNLHTANKGVTISLPANGVSKQFTWTMAGPDKQRWLELTNLTLVPGQAITMRLQNGGYEASFENTGPATTANLQVKAGPGANPVTVGQITIGSGNTTSFAFDAPLTTLTSSGGVAGNNGWLVSPVTITLTAKDYSGTGIAYTEYSTDGTTWTTYSGPFVYDQEGATTLYYRSRDNAGDLEAARSTPFKIDTKAPSTQVSPSFSSTGIALVFTVTDPTPGSEAYGLHYIVRGPGGNVVDSGFVANPAGTINFGSDFSDFEFWGEDVAGNLETHHHLHLSWVQPTLDQLSDYQALGDHLGSRDPEHGLAALLGTLPPGWRWTNFPKAVAIQVDLKTAQTVGGFKLYSNVRTKAPYTYFQYSQDALSWSDIPGLSKVDLSPIEGLKTILAQQSVTARYVRIVIDNTTYLSDIGYLSKLQLAIFTVDGGATGLPSALGIPVSHRLPIAGATASGGTASAVLDGFPATTWVVGNSPGSAQLVLDLGQQRSITALTYFVTASAVAYHTKIEISSDPGFPNDPTKTTVVADNINTGGSGGIAPKSSTGANPPLGTNTLSGFGTVTGRYIRITITNPERNWALGGYGEVDVLGY